MTNNILDQVSDPAEPSRFPSSEIIGKPGAFRVVDQKVMISTKVGESEAVIAETILAAPFAGSPYSNCGEVLIWWGQPMRQLRSAEAGKWTLGVVKPVEGERYYRIHPLDAGDKAAVVSALEIHLASPAPLARIEDDDTPFPGDDPLPLD